MQDWCREHKIMEKCHKGFWQCYENYKSNYPKEFSLAFRNENRKHVKLVREKLCLCLNYYIDYGRPTIQVDFHIMINDNYIGWYREVYFTNGEFVDDYFVIE